MSSSVIDVSNFEDFQTRTIAVAEQCSIDATMLHSIVGKALYFSLVTPSTVPVKNLRMIFALSCTDNTMKSIDIRGIDWVPNKIVQIARLVIDDKCELTPETLLDQIRDMLSK
jgi:hypothetical protein